jgi:exosortase/archaeosortase family protein
MPDRLSWIDGLTQRDAYMLRAIWFLARATVLALPLYLVIWLGLDLYPLQAATASQAAWILQVLGYHLTLTGTGMVMSNGFTFFIIADCTGWKSMLFLFALVFAYPRADNRKRLIAMAIGLPALWTLNLLRITGVVASQAAWGTETALMLHDTLFQALSIAAVLSIWVAWAVWLRTSGSRKASRRPRLSSRGRSRSS